VFVWFRIATFFNAEIFGGMMRMTRATRYMFDQILTACA